MYILMARRTSSDEIKVTIKRFGEDDESITVEKGATIWDALVKAGLPRDTEVRIDWDVYEAGDELEDGDELVVATKKYAQG